LGEFKTVNSLQDEQMLSHHIEISITNILTLFSYLDNGYLHQTIELPTVQEKSKQSFLAYLKAHQYKFRDEQDCSSTFTAPKVKKISAPTNRELRQRSMNSYDV
jgi:hypothetical protein